MKSNAVVKPNLGLYLDRPINAIPDGGLQDGLNFRVKEGKLSNLNLGWSSFNAQALNGASTMIDNFFLRDGTEKLLFGTPSDLFVYNPVPKTFSYITPIYATGTASSTGVDVTGIGTLWLANVKIGDKINFTSATYTTYPGTWFTVSNVIDNTHLTLSTTSGVVAAHTYTIRKVFTGTAHDYWVTDTFVNASPSNVDEWWATNGIDSVVRWNGTSTGVEIMSSLGFTCKTLAVYSNMMLFFNLVQGGTLKPTDMINSNTGEPQNVTTGLSEQFKVHSGTQGILRAARLGDLLAIYSDRGGPITLAQFTGDSLVFIFRNVMLDKGIIGPRALARFPDYHEFVSTDGNYHFDGASVKRQNMHVWREVLRQQDPIRVSQTYAYFDEQNGDLVWSVPGTTDTGAGSVNSPPAKAIVEHYLEIVGSGSTYATPSPTPHSRRSWPFTAASYYARADGITWDQLTAAWQTYNFRWNDSFFSAGFPLNIVGDTNGAIWTANTSQDANGVALASYVKFPRRATTDGRRRSLVSRVYPFVTQFATPITITAHFADHAIGPATIDAAYSFDQTLPEGRYFVPVYRRGRYVELEFGSAGPAQPWEVSGYDMDIRVGGAR